MKVPLWFGEERPKGAEDSGGDAGKSQARKSLDDLRAVHLDLKIEGGHDEAS